MFNGKDWEDGVCKVYNGICRLGIEVYGLGELRV